MTKEGYGEENVTGSVRQLVILAMACCLSIGSHFGSYLLGSLKSRLHESMGLSEAGFSALVSSFELVGTITPIASGLFVPRIGLSACGLLATGVTVLGMGIVCWREPYVGTNGVTGMVIGFLIFGIGISPLAVIQGSIILSETPPDQVGRLSAAGLLLGKAASFAAAFLAAPLADYSPRAPYFAALFLSLFSFATCLVYAWLSHSATAQLQSGKGSHVIERFPSLVELASLGDPVYIYLLICLLAGFWYAFLHLSSSLLEALYSISPLKASREASLVLLASVPLYPLIGWSLDKRPGLLPLYFRLAPALILATLVVWFMFTWLLPSSVSVLGAAMGIGGAPIIIVYCVKDMVPKRHIAIVLGAHKAVEMAGAVLVQVVAAWLLDMPGSVKSQARAVVVFFILLSALQFLSVHLWANLMKRRAATNREAYNLAPSEDDESDVEETVSSDTRLASADEMRRGKIGLRVSFAMVCLAWVAFAVTIV